MNGASCTWTQLLYTYIFLASTTITVYTYCYDGVRRACVAGFSMLMLIGSVIGNRVAGIPIGLLYYSLMCKKYMGNAIKSVYSGHIDNVRVKTYHLISNHHTLLRWVLKLIYTQKNGMMNALFKTKMCRVIIGKGPFGINTKITDSVTIGAIRYCLILAPFD